jgi:hypothetical protein
VDGKQGRESEKTHRANKQQAGGADDAAPLEPLSHQTRAPVRPPSTPSLQALQARRVRDGLATQHEPSSSSSEGGRRASSATLLLCEAAVRALLSRGPARARPPCIVRQAMMACLLVNKPSLSWLVHGWERLLREPLLKRESRDNRKAPSPS